MCGIAGIVRSDGAIVRPEDIQRLTDLIAHRGPDDAGVHVDGAIGLGHRRLSIVDLSPAGHQPMASADGALWLVFNGEIYNHEELRAELVGLGHPFRSTTDSEVILAAYRQWGERCVDRFEGMWAFAIWHAAERRLFCSRDRLGIKPFYYALGRQGSRSVRKSRPCSAAAWFRSNRTWTPCACTWCSVRGRAPRPPVSMASCSCRRRTTRRWSTVG